MQNLCLLFSFFLISVLCHSQENRALIIAISDYPEELGWEKTHAVNDCKLLLPMLQTNGYKKSNITIISDKEATKNKIVKQLKKLEKSAGPGDYIYIHFSGHGQQMTDDNGDEPDGLDEAFIPYDAYFRYTKGKYEGENHLRDDELEILIDDIRLKIGEHGNALVVIDACHSGSGTRDAEDDEYVRGSSYVFADPNRRVEPQKPGNLSFALKTGKGLSPVTVFSACQPDETNYEYKARTPPTYYGRLTYFFCNLTNEHNAALSYQTFYNRLKEVITASATKKSKKQTPYFESSSRENKFAIGK